MIQWAYKQLNDSVIGMQEKFKIDVEGLRQEQISVLKAIYKEGTRHLHYYHSSMSCFKYPEKRVKTFDTKYYEDVLPIVIDILMNNYPKIWEDLNKVKA